MDLEINRRKRGAPLDKKRSPLSEPWKSFGGMTKQVAGCGRAKGQTRRAAGEKSRGEWPF